jgi:hypothetical protein
MKRDGGKPALEILTATRVRETGESPVIALHGLDAKTADQLERLREACLECSDGDLSGFCGAVACMIQGCFGGRIIAGRVKGYRHYWNRLPCGIEVDLTSCQFGGDGFTPMAKGRATSTPLMTPIEFIMWTKDVLKMLKSIEENA